MQWDPIEEDSSDSDRDMEGMSARDRQMLRGERAAREAAEKAKTRLIGKKAAALSAKKAREKTLGQNVFEEKSGITKASPPYALIKKYTGLGRRRKTMKNPCWKGYVAYGMKKTRSGRVPNCVRKTRRSKSRK